METTLTMAGQLADAGAARLRGTSALVLCSPAAAAPIYGASAHQVFGNHKSATWTKGAFATSNTAMVLGRKDRPSRPLLELSP